MKKYTTEQIKTLIEDITQKYNWKPTFEIQKEDNDSILWIDNFEWEIGFEETEVDSIIGKENVIKYYLNHWREVGGSYLEPPECVDRLVCETTNIHTLISSLIRDYFNIITEDLELDIIEYIKEKNHGNAAACESE
ncbi:MAG: hypothetical protein M0P14_00825 [Alkaliphilus sp.]|nr:hypothetical protein [Alkaliphilus sp.]